MATPEKPSNAPSSTPKTAPAETKAALANTSAEVTKDIAEKQTVKDLEDLARDVQLTRLKEAEQGAVNTIQALPNNLDPEKATQEHLDTLDTFHMGSLFVIREILKGQTEIKAENISEFFKADISKFKDTEKVIWSKLKNIAANKDKYPKLYQDLFGQWAEGIALMKQKVDAEKAEAATTSEEKTESDKEKEDKKDGTLFDKVLEVAKKNPLLATVGAVGLGIALYNMWKNGGWQKGIVIGLFAMVGLGAFTSDAAKEIFKKLGVNMDDEDKKGKDNDNSTTVNAAGTTSPEVPAENTESDIEKYHMVPLKDAMGKFKQDVENNLEDAKDWFKSRPTLSIFGGALLAQNPVVHGIVHGSAAFSFHTLSGLAGFSFSTMTHHPVGGSLAILTFMGSKDKLKEKAENLGETLVPGTPEDMRKYLKDKLPEIQKYCSDNGLANVSDKDIDGAIDILYGNVPIQKMLPRGVKLGEAMFNILKEKLGTTNEKVIHNANLAGFGNLEKFIQKQKRDGKNKEEYILFEQSLSPLLAKLRSGKQLEQNDIAALSEDKAGKMLGFHISFDDGYIFISKLNEYGFAEGGFPRRLGITPTLSKEMQFRKALAFTVENDWIQATTPALTSGSLLIERFGNIIGEKINAKTPQEYLEQCLHKGYQLLIAGGEVILVGANKRFVMAPFHILEGVFGQMQGDDFAVTEFIADTSKGLLPVVALGMANNLRRLRNPFAEGLLRTVVQSTIYPLDSAIQGGNLVFKHIIPHVWAGEFDKVLSNPKNTVVHDFFDTVRKWQGISYDVSQVLPGVKANKALAQQAYELSDLHRALYLMHRADNRILQQSNLKAAERLLENNTLVKGKNISIKADTLMAQIPDLENALKEAESKFKTDKLKSYDKYKNLAKTVQHTVLPSTRPEIAVIPKNTTAALDEMEAIAKNIENKALNKRMALFEQYDKHINNYIKDQTERLGKSVSHTPEQRASLNKILQSHTERLANIKEIHAAQMVSDFKKLPLLKQTDNLAEQINKHILSDSDKFLTKTIFKGKGRALMFAAQFATVLTLQKTIEYTTDEEKDLEKTLESIAGPDTLQLFVDLLPGISTMSNFYSAITGQKSLTAMGITFKDSNVDRATSLGWGVVSFGQDLLTLIPAAGVSIRGALILARLKSLVGKVPAASKLFSVFGKISKLADKIGWNETVPKVVAALSKSRGAIGKATVIGGAAMTAYTLGSIAVNYAKPRSIELAVPYEKVSTNTVSGTMPRSQNKAPNQNEERLVA